MFRLEILNCNMFSCLFVLFLHNLVLAVGFAVYSYLFFRIVSLQYWFFVSSHVLSCFQLWGLKIMRHREKDDADKGSMNVIVGFCILIILFCMFFSQFFCFFLSSPSSSFYLRRNLPIFHSIDFFSFLSPNYQALSIYSFSLFHSL